MSERQGDRVSKGIGAASDYYRLRVTRLTEGDAPDFEWREDILYRDPPIKPAGPESVTHRIEAVALDDSDNITVIGLFESGPDAAEAIDTAGEDLVQLTRSEFEDRYFPA